LGCEKRVFKRREDGSGFDQEGDFAHILPLGYKGPRSEYLAELASVEINSHQNIILLCPNHHREVDGRAGVEQFPPHILYAMKILSEDQSPPIFDDREDLELRVSLEELGELVEVTNILRNVRDAIRKGPKTGGAEINKCRKLFRTLRSNPLVPGGQDTKLRIHLEIESAALQLLLQTDTWTRAAGFLNGFKLSPEIQTTTAFRLFRLIIEIAGDPHAVLGRDEKLNLIDECLKIHKELSKREANSAQLAKSIAMRGVLLRWKGRFEASLPKKRAIFSEARRALEKSNSMVSSMFAAHQIAMLDVNEALSMPYKETSASEQLIDQATLDIKALADDDYPPAVLYLPRLLREQYRFEESVECYLSAIVHYESPLLKDCYILGEAAFWSYRINGNPDAITEDILSLLKKAISVGYCSPRIIGSYVACAAVMNPSWFLDNIGPIFAVEKSEDTEWWPNMIEALRSSLAEDFRLREPNFGFDNGEFWNHMGSIFGTLGDNETAYSLYQTGLNHSTHNKVAMFRSYCGLAKYGKLLGHEDWHKYKSSAASSAMPHQRHIVESL